MKWKIERVVSNLQSYISLKSDDRNKYKRTIRLIDLYNSYIYKTYSTDVIVPSDNKKIGGFAVYTQKYKK